MLASRFRTSVLAASLALTTDLATREARADGADAREAEQLVDEADILTRIGNYADACPRLEESQRLVPKNATRFRLAACRTREGKKQAAREIYEALASDDNEDDRTKAKAALAALDAGNAPGEPEATTPDVASPPSAGSPLRTVSYVTMALGVVGLGVGGYFGVTALAHRADAAKACPARDTCHDLAGHQAWVDATSAGTTSTILVAAGGGLLATGLTLFVLSSKGSEARVSARGATLSLEGAF